MPRVGIFGAVQHKIVRYGTIQSAIEYSAEQCSTGKYRKENMLVRVGWCYGQNGIPSAQGCVEMDGFRNKPGKEKGDCA